MKSRQGAGDSIVTSSRAVAWMEKNQPNDPERRGFRAEALLGMARKPPAGKENKPQK